MPKVLFYPEKRKNETGVLRVKNLPILLFFSFEAKRLQFYSGERIDLKDWDFKTRKVAATHPEYVSINQQLEQLSRRVQEAYREMKLSGQVIEIKALRIKIREQLKNGKFSFFDCLILFIEEKNPKWTLSTYRKIKTFYNHMRNFRSRTGIDPDMAHLDDTFFKALNSYFRNDCGHIDSTIKKSLEVFMWFMNWAQKKGFHRNFEYRKILANYMLLNNTAKEDFSLSLPEVNEIRMLQLTNRKEMLARDVFVFSCYTGLSCPEIRQLRPSSIEEDWIKVNIGSRIRSIPVLSEAKLIALKYIKPDKLSVFPKVYPGKINRYLKEIARKANLNREIKTNKYINGIASGETMPAYRLLTLSVARKTFIHLALASGISPFIVAQTAGYKTMNAIDQQSAKIDYLKFAEFKKFGL